MKQLQIKEITEEAVLDLSRPEQANFVLTYLLEKLGATDAENSKSTQQVLDEYLALCNENPSIVYITDASLSNYLSILSRKSWSRISCNGKKQGYFLSPDTSQEETEQENTKEDFSDTRPLECDLYSYLMDWVSSEGYNYVRDISSGRRMVPWGNPDVLGIKIVRTLLVQHLEVMTIEAKNSCSKWQRDIFEAVAHTMFSNRVYYAYRRKASDKDNNKMIDYAMKFNIGILAIVIPDDEWNQKFNSSTAEIVKVVPAPYQRVDAALQKDFLDSLAIKEMSDLLDKSNNSSTNCKK